MPKDLHLLKVKRMCRSWAHGLAHLSKFGAQALDSLFVPIAREISSPLALCRIIFTTTRLHFPSAKKREEITKD